MKLTRSTRVLEHVHSFNWYGARSWQCRGLNDGVKCSLAGFDKACYCYINRRYICLPTLALSTQKFSTSVCESANGLMLSFFRY